MPFPKKASFPLPKTIAMKKCKKCGALQSDDRTTCIDCEAILGAPISEAEEDAISDRIDDLSEHAQDFYVPVRDKIMGALCVVGVIAMVVLLILAGKVQAKLSEKLPDDAIWQRDGAVISYGTFSTESGFQYVEGAQISNWEHDRMEELTECGSYALIGIVCFGAAFPMLLFPKLMWYLDTLKYRLWYHDADPSPTYFAIFLRKAMTYILFAGGIGCAVYGFMLYV